MDGNSKSLPVKSTEMYSHRLPFNANELLLLTSLSYAMLSDPAFAASLALIHNNEYAFDLMHLRQLRQRLEIFIKRGARRVFEREQRGSEFFAQVANCSLLAAETPLPFDEGFVKYVYASEQRQSDEGAGDGETSHANSIARTEIDRDDYSPASGLERVI